MLIPLTQAKQAANRRCPLAHWRSPKPFWSRESHDPVADAVADLGAPDLIQKVFTSFHRYLYVEVAV
jgi:hypothetical protein